MNKERILALADLIEKQPHSIYSATSGFNMGSITHDCGTPSCIAGWAAWEAQGRPEIIEERTEDWSVENEAALFLGIPDIENGLSIEEDHTYRLFYPVGLYFDDITPAHAAFTLRHLAETGEVDWSAYEAVRGASLNEGAGR